MELLLENKPFAGRVQFAMGHSIALAMPLCYFATLAENPTVQIPFVAFSCIGAFFFFGSIALHLERQVAADWLFRLALAMFLCFSILSAYGERLGWRRVAMTVLLIASSFTLRSRRERVAFNGIMISGLVALTLWMQTGYRLVIPLAVGALLVFVVGEVFEFIDRERLKRETALRLLLDSSPLPSLIVRGGVCEYSNLAAQGRFEVLTGELLRDFLLGIPPWWGATALGHAPVLVRFPDGSTVSAMSHFCPLGLDPNRMYVVIVPPDQDAAHVPAMHVFS